jgi:DNA-directed RNA polymerase subunit beta
MTRKPLNNNRIDYSKISGTLPLPNLVEIQTESFRWFIEKGVDIVLKDVFPIANYSETLQIEYVSCRFESPKYNFLECKERDTTFSAPLRVVLRLRFLETGEVKESEVFMGDFPLMTDSGTFIINGAERVIVSQLVRSPGAYMSKVMDNSGKYLYEGDLIPTRGTWLQFESDQKDILSVRIDRQRKMNATILLRALGLENNEDIISLFGDHDNLNGTLEKDGEINSAKTGTVVVAAPENTDTIAAGVTTLGTLTLTITEYVPSVE